MGRQRVVKLSEEEYQMLLKAKDAVKQFGVETFSKTAQGTVKNSALGDYVHLGAQLIVEHFADRLKKMDGRLK